MNTLYSIKNTPILEEMIEQLDLPDYIEEKVHDRYESLSKWFGRENSSLKDIDIDIFAQGSFSLGTTIKPINPEEEYDLDMGCKLNINDYKYNHSQEELKNALLFELEAYRKSVNIQNSIEEKRRCLRLAYKDTVPFHLDIVPCIPLNEEKKAQYRSILFKDFQNNDSLATDVAKYALNITDNESKNYKQISDNWHISNPQGYLLWFQERMTPSSQPLFEARATVSPIPTYKEKTILQRCVQLLKRHRDNMFKDPKVNDSKPISIIITTLAARAYNGEDSLEQALLNILQKMPQYINSHTPRIPNPVKPEEDFTDRWDNPKFEKLKLEENFKAWLSQATVDFKKLLSTNQVKEFRTILIDGFNLDISERHLQHKLGYQLSNIETKTITTPYIQPWANQ